MRWWELGLKPAHVLTSCAPLLLMGWSHTGTVGPVGDHQSGLPQQKAGLRRCQSRRVVASALDRRSVLCATPKRTWRAMCAWAHHYPRAAGGWIDACGRSPDACGLPAQLRLRPALPSPARTCSSTSPHQRLNSQPCMRPPCPTPTTRIVGGGQTMEVVVLGGWLYEHEPGEVNCHQETISDVRGS